MTRLSNPLGMVAPASRRDETLPRDDSGAIDEPLIRAVVVEFYRRARRDERLGPVFEAHISGWDEHLATMVDFWSAVILRTGRYAGNPLQSHRMIDGLNSEHFQRWMELFEATVRDLCGPAEAEAFLLRARRMRHALTAALNLAG